MRCAHHTLIILLLCSICPVVSAATVHQWVDASGITHFSDSPPPENVSAAKTLELSDDFPPAVDTRSDYYSIANQWDRMRQERDAKSRLRLERDKIRAERAAAVAYSEPQQDYGSERYYPLYLPNYGYGGPYARHRGPHHRVPRGAHRGRGGHARAGGIGRGRPGRGYRSAGHRGRPTMSLR